MDRSWMLEARTSDAYLSGIEQFLSFAVKNANKQRRKPVLIRCPCFECDNVPPGLNISEVRNHLVCAGFDPGYSKWFWHGEDCGFTSNVEDEDVVQCDEDVGEAEFLEDEDVEMVEGASDDLRSDPITFHEQLKDAEKPLYKGCSKFSKLSALAELYNFKAGNGLSDKGFSELLEILKDMLPEENELPKSTYKVKKTLNSLGLGYEKIHACSNDCILYRKEYRDLNACPTCKRSRWMPNKHPRKGSKGVPVKVMWYFSPIPRFKRMFGDERVAKEFLWHHEEIKKDGVLRHPADTPAWQLVNDKWPEFAEEPRNLRLALSADGVNPHSSLRNKHSCWPVMMAIYNLPPGLCMKKEYMMLTMLISGHPGKEIDVYLAPLIDDLKLLWDVGVEVYDSNKGQNFILKAVLMWTINDFPSYGDLSGCSTQGYKACPICSEKTYSKWLMYSRKVCYTGHRRFLPSKHPFRRQMKAFDGKQEFDSAPGPLSGEETFNKVCNLQVIFGKKKKQKRAVSMTLSKLKKSKKSKKSNKSRKNEDEDCVDISRKRKRSVGEQLQVTRDNHHVDAFKKKSIFFELEYWKYLLVRHMLDVMHIEKNVCESILATVLDVAGKSKDDLNSRLDLKDMGIKEELQPKDLENGTFLPPACFKLTKEEKFFFCTVLSQLKVPSGYSSSLRNCVSMDDLKLQGLKSHDYHVLMQELLPIAIRSVLPQKVRYVITRLCFFFKALCSKEVDGRNAPTCDSTNARSSSESHERISRLEAQLAMFLMNQGAEASVTTKHNNSAVSKPTSSAASSPKVFKDGEEKGEAQSNLHVGLGKGKSCKLYLEGSSIAVATGKVFRTRSSDVLHGNAIGKGNVRVCLEVPLKPRSRLPIPLKAEEEICFIGDAAGYHVAWPKKLVVKGGKSRKHNKD